MTASDVVFVFIAQTTGDLISPRKKKKLTRSQEWSREGSDDGKGGGGELHLLVGKSKQATV